MKFGSLSPSGASAPAWQVLAQHLDRQCLLRRDIIVIDVTGR